MSVSLFYALLELAMSLDLFELVAQFHAGARYLTVYLVGVVIGIGVGVLWTRASLRGSR